MPGRSPSKPRIDVGPAVLAPLGPDDAGRLGPALAAIDPWARMGYPEAALTAFLHREDPGLRRLAVRRGGDLAGCVAVRDPWLKGPYLQVLGILPPWQGRGIGSAILAWFEREAGPEARNLWVVASAFNEGALRFYRAHGFQEAARLPDLVADGHDEILMRKFPLGRDTELD